MDCSICCNAFTTVLRKPITCSFCHFQVCTKCVKSYLLSTMKDPHCMKCNVGWNREFIDESLSKTFRTGELKHHRENLLLEREKGMLPATVPLVERRLAQRVIEDEMGQLMREKNDLLGKLQNINMILIEKRRNIISLERTNVNDLQTTSRTCQGKCPNEECRGFLSNYKCGICNVKVCNKCNVILGTDDHTCKEEDIATAKLLAKDTKYCPNDSCRTPIYKIDGCNQMWCTKCHTAFDWRSGDIVENASQIHNPHYYEWLRKNNGVIARTPGDVPCGGFPTIRHLMHTLKVKNLDIDLTKYHRGVTHIIHWEIRQFPVDIIGGGKFTELRIKYLMNELDETEWKRKLQHIEKMNERNIAFRNVFDMLNAASTDLFTRVMNSEKKDNVNLIIDEFEELRVYFNTCLRQIYERFDSKAIKELDLNWQYNYV